MNERRCLSCGTIMDDKWRVDAVIHSSGCRARWSEFCNTYIRKGEQPPVKRTRKCNECGCAFTTKYLGRMNCFNCDKPGFFDGESVTMQNYRAMLYHRLQSLGIKFYHEVESSGLDASFLVENDVWMYKVQFMPGHQEKNNVLIGLPEHSWTTRINTEANIHIIIFNTEKTGKISCEWRLAGWKTGEKKIVEHYNSGTLRNLRWGPSSFGGDLWHGIENPMIKPIDRSNITIVNECLAMSEDLCDDQLAFDFAL